MIDVKFVPREKPVKALVLLDCARQLPEARIGLFTMGFADEAKRVIEALTNNNLAVMLSADSNEVSWPAPELGGTVFGVNVLRGLQGMANSDNDSRITVKELSNFVTRDTQAYVAKSRQTKQTPVLCWPGKKELDFEVAYVGRQRDRYYPKQKPQIRNLQWQTTALQDSWEQAKNLSDLHRNQLLAIAGPHYSRKVEGAAPSSTTPPPQSREDLTGVSLYHLSLDPSKVSVPYKPSESPAPATPEKTQNTSATDQDKSTAEPKPANPPPTPSIKPVKEGEYLLSEAIEDWLESPSPPDPTKPLAPPQLASSSATQIKLRHLTTHLCIEWLKSDRERFQISALEQIVQQLLSQFKSDVGLSKEEALLRNIYEHLKVTEQWPLEPDEQIDADTWIKLLEVHKQYELALFVNDPRASFALESLSEGLCEEYRYLLDLFFNADTRNAVTQANKQLVRVRDACGPLAQQRDLLEKAWRLRDEACFAVPILFDWQTSLLRYTAMTLMIQLAQSFPAFSPRYAMCKTD